MIHQPVVLIKMLFIILIQALLMLPLKGANGQEIVFDPLRNTSHCTKGLRNGTDNFTFTGTVGKNYTALISSKWSNFVTVQISDSSLQFVKICDIFIGLTGTYCDPSSTDTCYCDHIDTTTGAAHFVINYRAQPEYSERIFRAQWVNENGTTIYSNNTAPLPVIYDKADIILTVNGVASTPVHFISNKNNTVQLCCIDSASPCYARLSFNGTVVESQTNCVKHTVFVPDVKYTANVASSYSMCTKSDYITASSVIITTVEEKHSNQGFDERKTSPCNITMNEVNTNRPHNSQQHHTVEENGSIKQFTNKTNYESARKNMKLRQLPPLKGISPIIDDSHVVSHDLHLLS